MKRLFVVTSVCNALFLASVAFAQSQPADAGAAADQAFSPGPGGGEPDGGNERPPLQSTGLEDTGFGCSCRTARAPDGAQGGLLVAGLVAGAVLGRRRSSRNRG